MLEDEIEIEMLRTTRSILLYTDVAAADHFAATDFTARSVLHHPCQCRLQRNADVDDHFRSRHDG